MKTLLILTALLVLAVATPAWAVQATLAWSDDGANPTRVEKAALPAGPWTNLTPTPLAAGIKAFVDPAVALGAQVCYRVTKTGALGDSTPLQGCGTPNATNPATGLTIIFTP